MWRRERTIVQPSLDEVIDFCARAPVERVFLEDIARRGYGHFAAVRGDDGLTALCHTGANLVPSGSGCGAFAEVAGRGRSRMVIGEEGAVTDFWNAARTQMPTPREDRPGQPVFALDTAPPSGETGLRPALHDDLDVLVPACARAHCEELGVDPLAREAAGFRARTIEQINEGRSWIWLENGVIRFKAEVSAWTPTAAQVQQVWVDPAARGRGDGSRGLRDLCRLLLARTPVVTLFVRTENATAISLYESVGMIQVLTYRSILFP